MPEPDDFSKVEDELAALMRDEFGFEPHRLDPPKVEPKLVFEPPAAAPVAAIAVRRSRRPFALVAAAVVAAAVGLGAYVLWPEGDSKTRASVADGPSMLVVTPGGASAVAEFKALSALAAKVPGSSTTGKDDQASFVRSFTWTRTGSAVVTETFASEDGLRTITREGPGFTADGNVDGSPDGSVTSDSTKRGAGVGVIGSLPRTPEKLAVKLAELAGGCNGSDAYCASLGLRDLATSYFLQPRVQERILFALRDLDGFTYSGTATDRLGRSVQVFSTGGSSPGESLSVLFDSSTGQYLGDEVDARLHGSTVLRAVHYVVDARVPEPADIPPSR